MDSTKRIIVNTLVQYSRSVINIILSLFSTRLVVEALGASDYGIYIVVGGVVAMLGFITNALVVTTQRYVSFYHGQKDIKQVKKIFSNSLFVHVLFSLVMLSVLFALKDVMIHQWLNILPDRLEAADSVYIISMFLLVVTILIAPFKALYIARENIIYISVIEICDGILKVAIAVFVMLSTSDKLLLYAFMMLGVQMINLIAFASYAMVKYEECKILTSYKDIDSTCIKQLSGFAGWSIYSSGSIVVRNQGIQILLNRVYGTTINAAYGIATMVYGSVSFVSSSVLNAMNPQIIKAEGEGNRKKMLYLAEMESKYSSMLLILVLVPLIFETPAILEFWLKDVPQYADVFCRFILCGFLFDQLTYGMNTANQAIGKIRNYVLIMYTPKMLVIPVVYWLITKDYSPVSVMWVYLFSEILVALARLPYIKILCGLSIQHFCKVVIFPLVPLALIQCLVCALFVFFMDAEMRFLITVPVAVVSGLSVIWYYSLDKVERDYVINIVNVRLLHKKNNQNICQ